MEKVKGLIAAAFTPMLEDGSVNHALIQPLVDKLVADGLTGIFVCGSNGEGPNMTTAERMAVAASFVKAAQKRLLIFIHVGHSSIAEARVLAAHAQEIGADAISAVAAFYFKPVNVQNLADCMAEIASAAPQLPFYYYHIPHLTGVGMDMIEFLKVAGPAIPNLAGIKYTATTLHEYQACLNFENGKFDILYGLDEMLLPALAVGAQGAIGSTYTFAAPLYLQTIAAFRKGDIEKAQVSHSYMVEVIRILVKYPPIPGQKAIMDMLGWNLGPCRLPLTTLHAAAYEKFQEELSALSFFDKAPVRKLKELK
ncbi:N-acetylneuraminate lyase [Chitinophaga sp. SYP-B3965]|uniref:dihydrodipicolinate synthase family protein n=1 Tax=Chitinophaga sp. SYP-B3965 TaxID=2663120 RepID=UPI001299CB6A|nr:dihydrodipicolinate synthase family protein [Chitinophaga sp. SYP-B3965]MRG49148.1 N-acetylneuraminate lyase [Chitinophaga sp. SYP-B3965]